MRKLVPKLEKHNFVVIDHTVSGWVPTPGNVAKLAEKIETAKPSDYVIADLLGNVTHRYAQTDGTLAMPYKVENKYHFDGEITVCNLSNLKSIVENQKPSLLKCRCHLVLTPPLPRHLHDGCCNSAEHCTNVGSENHAESMLGKLDSIRTALVSNLELIGQKDFSVPHLIKLSMPACTDRSEYVKISHELRRSSLLRFRLRLPHGRPDLAYKRRGIKKSETIFCRMFYFFRCEAYGETVVLLVRLCLSNRNRKTDKPQSCIQAKPLKPRCRKSYGVGGGGGKWQASNTSIHNLTPYGGGKRIKSNFSVTLNILNFC